MEDIRPFNDISRSSTTIPMVSPIPFETASDQYYFSPISNQIQGTSPEVYWQYNDHRRSPYPNGFNNVGQYQYWRHSPYPTGDQMLMREWSTSSPDHCNYQIPPWSMEAVSMVQGMNMHHGISQWSSGSARTSLDFSGSGDTSMSDLVIPPEFSRDEHMSLEQENRSCNSFSASPWQQSSSAPLMTELLGGEPKYSSCRWQADVIPNLCDSNSKDLENKCKKTEPKTQEFVACKKKIEENNTESPDIEPQEDSKKNNDKSVPERTPQKSQAKPSRKPEAYDRQKKVQRQREGLIRNAIQSLNLILPDDNKGKKLSKNLVLLKAIDYIKKLKEQLGDIPIERMEMIDDEIDAIEDSPHRKPRKRKKISTSNVTKIKEKEGPATPEKISCKLFKVTSPQLPPSSSSPSPPKLTHPPLPPKPTPSPSRAPSNLLSLAATNDYRGAEKKTLLDLLQDPAILTPSDTSSGSERAESPTTDDDALHHEGENKSHVKRPMNAFLLFSKSNRENFKKLYPGKDNRRISTILGEHWNTMKSEEKQPFQEMARELMRKTKETYPDFKYSPTDQSSKFKAFRFIGKEDSPKKGVRVGNHRLRSRYAKERNSDSSISPDVNCFCKESYVMDNTSTTLLNKHLSKTEPKPDKQQPTNQLQEQKHQEKEEKEKANKDYTRYSRCDNWVQCDKCRKWRMLEDDVNLDELPDKWFCWLSPDPRVNNCQVPEAVRWTEMRKRGILKDGE